MANEIIGPQSDFQEKYLNSDARFMIVGGAAGSSKSYIGLMRHLRWAHLPNYVGYCIRKNKTTAMVPGGLWDKAIELYSKYDPKIRVKTKDSKIIFSSGATIGFGHYENTQAGRDLYQGQEIHGILYDEAAQAEEEHIWWLISRLRNNPNTALSIWCTMNPDPDCWAMPYVLPYLYPEGHELAGRPNPEINGKIKYLHNLGGILHWADTEQELLDQFDFEEGERPFSFQCLFGTLYDNPSLMKNDPSYLTTLKALPHIEQERLLRGNWFARAEGAGYFKREWVEEIPSRPLNAVQRIRAWDLAGTLPSDAYPDPDYTANVLMSKDAEGNYVIEEVNRFRVRVGELQNIMLETAARDGTNTTIIVPVDPGIAGKAWSSTLLKALINNGFTARLRPTSKSKIDRFNPFAVAAENGLVKIVKNCFTGEGKDSKDNTTYYQELERFDGTRKFKDDLVDATGDAFMALNTRNMLSDFSSGLVEMKQRNPFNFVR